MIPPYATTLGGLDLIAVQRYLDDDRPYPHLTESEQRYAARRMAEAGLSAKAAAARLGVTERTIARWLAKETNR